MPTYKLIYFNMTGLVEQIRYMFHYGGIKFEDVRLDSDDWPKYKDISIFEVMGHLPVLMIDGKKYHQSKAIARYIAKKCNLYSSDEIEALEIDATVDSLDDVRQIMRMYYWEKDAVVKEKLKKAAYEKLPFYFDKFEEQVKKNGGHFVRGKLTWPDVMYAAYIGFLCGIVEKEINKDHPELKKLVDKVNSIPSIKAYLDKRPKTTF